MQPELRSAQYSCEIGNKIRFFRKERGLSLDALSTLVHKSKSTLSKYEHGAIPIDVDTLCEIAFAMKVSPRSFFSFMFEEEQEQEFSEEILSDGSMTAIHYMYLWDGRPHRKLIVQSVLETDPNSGDAILYWNTPNAQDYLSCNWIYQGKRVQRGAMVRFTLKNLTNKVDLILINYLDPFVVMEVPITANMTYCPVGQYENYCTKCLISSVPLPMNKSLLEQLAVSKFAISELKKTNLLRLNII